MTDSDVFLDGVSTLAGIYGRQNVRVTGFTLAIEADDDGWIVAGLAYSDGKADGWRVTRYGNRFPKPFRCAGEDLVETVAMALA